MKKSLLSSIFCLLLILQVRPGFEAPPISHQAKVGVAVGTVLGFYSYYFVKHGIQLYRVQQKLKNAMVESTNKGYDFSFATWQRNAWLTGADLLRNKTKVYEQLKREATKLSDKVFVYDAAGTRIMPQRIKMVDVQSAIAKEKERYEELLEFVGGLTDAPYQTVQIAKERGYCDVHGYVRLYDNQQALINAAKLQSLDEQSLREFGHELHARCTPKVSRWVLCMPRYNPLTWAVAPWYPWAAQLYWFLYKNYIRLLTVKAIVDGHIVEKAQGETVVLKQLRLLKDQVAVMRACQPAVHVNNDERSRQHANIYKFNEDLKRLIAHVQSHDEHRTLMHALNALARHVPTIQQQLQFYFDAGRDPVVPMLETLDQELGRLIEVQEQG